ncbi:hypothetical protein BT69DRAFT_1296288 [Atractiella rhizophila]|nr:hypothetical protein BT69DRAFT_1296288 [Atractiella rhizophila]
MTEAGLYPRQRGGKDVAGSCSRQHQGRTLGKDVARILVMTEAGLYPGQPGGWDSARISFLTEAGLNPKVLLVAFPPSHIRWGSAHTEYTDVPDSSLIPPQQGDWYTPEELKEVGGQRKASKKAALKKRLNMMDERNAFVQKNDKVVLVSFWSSDRY